MTGPAAGAISGGVCPVQGGEVARTSTGELSSAVRAGRCAVHWSWYVSVRYGAESHGRRGYNSNTRTFGDYPGWRVMRSQPQQRFGVAGGNRGARRKVHMVRDQVVAKHRFHSEQRMTRWLCGAYTFDGVLQKDSDTVCSLCLLIAQHRTTEPLPKGDNDR